jgi:hypothetical protein
MSTSVHVHLKQQHATHSVFSTNKLCDNCGGGGRSEAKEEGGKHDQEPLTRFAKAHPAYKTAQTCGNIYSNVGHDKQKILNLELVLLHLKHTVSN